MKRCDKADDEDGFLQATLRYHEVFVEITRNPVLISIEQCVERRSRKGRCAPSCIQVCVATVS